MNKIGIKLLSTDIDKYGDKIIELFTSHVCDYIELHVVPDSTDLIPKWNNLEIPTPNGNHIKIPFILHIMDNKDGINLSNPNNIDINKKYFEQLNLYKQKLYARSIIVSSGRGGVIGETARQLKMISPQNMLIKNNALKFADADTQNGVGATIEEISKIKKELNCGLCLDISNAICTANIQNKMAYEYIREFNSLGSIMYRISGNNVTDTINKHEGFSTATYDFSIISLIIRSNSLITVNTTHTTNDLSDFRRNVQFIKRFFK